MEIMDANLPKREPILVLLNSDPLYLQPQTAKKASLAQLVERRIRNAQVVGSSPIGGSLKRKG